MEYIKSRPNILDFGANHRCARPKYDFWTLCNEFYNELISGSSAYFQLQRGLSQTFFHILAFRAATTRYHFRLNDQSKGVAVRQCPRCVWRKSPAGMGWSRKWAADSLNRAKLLRKEEMLDQNSTRSVLARKPKCCELGKEACWIAELATVGNEGSKEVKSWKATRN